MMCRWKRRLQKSFVILVALALTLFSVVALFLQGHGGQHLSSEDRPLSMDDKQTSSQLDLLINTTNCKIPNFPPWSPAARVILPKRCTSFFQGEPKCADKHLHSWSYVNGSVLHINLTAVRESGYSWNSIRCCYRVISAVEEFLEDSDMHPMKMVSLVRYSEDCHLVKTPTELIDAEFIRLHCVSTSLPLLNDVVSREFLAIAKPDKRVLKKMENWASRKDDSSLPPPNVIILGVDTMSRLNAWRNFNGKTLEVLRCIGAVEMKGYTKVGENTFPNTAAFLAGYDLGELLFLHCVKNLSYSQDYCPYLWKPFDKLGYLTATMEDSYLGTFRKMGFLQKPTDFYLRPFIFAVFKNLKRWPYYWYLRCLGRHKIEEVILNYLEDILKLAAPSGSPLFAHVWLTSASHDCGTAPKYIDALFASTIQKLTSVYANTILIFMGDHGETFGEFRESIQGWYEDKLPMAWIYLPPVIREKFPSWQESLQINSKRLTSHFDLYKTLVQVLQAFDKDNLAQETYRKLSRQKGQSLFEPVSLSRTCEDSGIPEGYCACAPPEVASVEDESIVRAAQGATEHIANLLPGVCEVPTLKEIKRAWTFQISSGHMGYVVTFVTDPGDFLFEATLRERSTGSKQLMVTSPILRLNKMERMASCVSKAEQDKLCYCK